MYLYIVDWYDDNKTLSSSQVQLLARLPSLVRELDLFFWTMYDALAVKAEYKSVPAMELETMIVPTLKMLVLNAKVIILYELC